MTIERKAELFDNLVEWAYEHDAEFIDCFLTAAGATPTERIKIETEGVEDPDFDIFLEEDGYELDMKTGTLKIDKQVFNDFEKDSYINIHFSDEENEPTFQYAMIREDDEFIYCDYLGEV